MTTRCNALQAYMTAGTTRALAATFSGAEVDMWSPIPNGTHADPKHGQPLRTKDSP